MLERGRGSLPDSAIEKMRFEVPKIIGHIEGTKTILTNMMQIASTFGREPHHLMKFILREVGTAGDFKGQKLVLKRKIPASLINEKVRKYADEFVLCHDCGKPDTKIEREGSLNFIKCMACGARHSIKSKI